jgi:hypothetical protein
VNPLSSSSSVTEAQVITECGAWEYFLASGTTIADATPADPMITFDSASNSFDILTYDVTKSVTNYNSEAEMSEKIYPLVLMGRLSIEYQQIMNSASFDLYVRYHCWKAQV